jgi:predicted N-acyltransferase
MTGDQSLSYSVAWVNGITEIDRHAWNALAGPLQTPILEWEWLNRMEVSGSIAAETGWLPYHLTVWSDHQLVGAAPLYIKSHSAGEFVYDYMWVDVANQIGAKYYPKLVGMCPATPSVGYRFLIAPGEDEQRLTELMVAEIDRLCQRHNIHGCSFLFVDPLWKPLVERAGFSAWLHQSYAWLNPGYECFDDYLSVFNKNQRRNIKRERKALLDQGVTMKTLIGDEIPRSFFALMYDLYAKTNAQFGPWAAKYLNREFFEGLYEDFRHRLLFVTAHEDNEETPVAMSFLLAKRDLLVGRYWGTFKWIDALHFNACYYTPIEWAIERGMKKFDPGAGSSHKLRRGFQAVPNHSLHRFYDENMRKIMATYISKINMLEEEQIDTMNRAVPFASGREPAVDVQSLNISRENNDSGMEAKKNSDFEGMKGEREE